jgi:hypothetical protein
MRSELAPATRPNMCRLADTGRLKCAAWLMRGGSWSIHHYLQMSARQNNPTPDSGTRRSVLATPAVVVLGGDAVVGQALELLLRDAQYSARFLAKPSLLEEPGILDGVQLVILAPGLGAVWRGALLPSLGSILAAAKIPVLELVDDPEAVRADSKSVIPWPCRIQYLKQHIEAALRTGPEQTEPP